MIRALLAMRFLLLLAALGAGVGALLMLALGGIKLAGAVGGLFAAHGAHAVIGGVMGATDALLFAVVLFVFAFAIAFNFAIDLPADRRASLPRWMHVGSIGQLKRTLVEVVLVFLVVDFATDAVASEEALGWTALVLPVSVVLIALAVRLWPDEHEHGHGHG